MHTRTVLTCLQTSLSGARAEAAQASAAEHAQRTARVAVERQLEAAACIARQQAVRLEQLEGMVWDCTSVEVYISHEC